MAEPDKQQLGEGQDNFGQAAGQAAKAAKQFSQQAAMKGAEATANAATATVQAGVQTGKAAAEIAAGTAAGGPWGAILSAAWAMRHTLFKVLVCICLVIVFLVVLLCSIPSIIFSYLFGSGASPPDTGSAIEISYAELSEDVSAVIDAGYERSLARIEEIIRNGGYDYDLSMEALVNNAQSSAGYDVSYILAAYSASLEQKDTTAEDMVTKLSSVSGQMFPVSYEEKQLERLIPVTYQTYKQVTVTVVTQIEAAGIVNGVPRFNYYTERRTYYLPDQTRESDEPVTIPKYKSVYVTVPTYSDGEISGTRTATYYEANGTQTVRPTTEIIKYVACTIAPFDNSVIAGAFDLDLTAQYPQFNITYGEAIQNMANSLKRTLYGSLGSGQAVPLTDAELLAFVAQQNCTPVREHILKTALSLVGRVPYFWGGKSPPGWNDEWNTPKLVTSAGSSSTGTIRPYGLDCSGFSDWVYKTAVGVSLYGSTWSQWDNSYAISASELQPGDLGFLMNEDGAGWNHVLLFAGYGAEGQRMWVHCTSGKGVVLNTPSYEARLSLRRPKYVDFDAPLTGLDQPLYAIEVDVTHYCACSLCCGSNADGFTASGKRTASGMVAMSSYYPFGTQIMINGVMYTVEDRGGSGIENDISRVDIFVPDHNEALRRGALSNYRLYLQNWKVIPMNLYYRIHLINGDIITAWEPVKEDGKDLITRFGEADPDDLLEIGDNTSSMAFIPVRNIMFISRRQRSKP